MIGGGADGGNQGGPVRVLRTVLALACLVAFMAQTAAAADVKWTHCKFAVWLVKKANAEYLLPAAATCKDYFDLLRRNGIEPPGGWVAEKIITVADLEAMLGLKPGSGKSLDELMKMLGDSLSDLLYSIDKPVVVSPAFP